MFNLAYYCSLNVKCPPWVYMFENLIPVVILFGKVVKPLRDEALLEEVSYCVVWEVLLYMCCFYWLMHKEAALACDRAE